jgi:large subunit ribosomal protein L9
VKVRPGYARNFLYPRSLALPATSGNLARVEDFRRLARARAEAARKEAVATAEQVSAVSVKIVRAVGEENKMYGSVTSRDIEQAYAEKGITLDRKHLDLPEPIRTLGLTEVKVRLYADVTAVLRVEVVKQT